MHGKVTEASCNSILLSSRAAFARDDICGQQLVVSEIRTLLEGSWCLLTNYNCTYNPTYNTPKGP